MTTKELADHLKVHPETIRRMVKRGQIPYIKISETNFKFELDTVLEVLQNNGGINED